MNQLFKGASVSFRRDTASQWGDDRLKTANPSPLQFSLRQFSASDPGSTPATARSLGSFPGKRRIKGTVSRTDRDVYQFTFGDLTNLRIKLKNSSKVNIFGDILDSQGQVLTFKGNKLSVKVKSGKAIENFYEELPSGVYFLRIRGQGSGKNTYQLKLVAANTFPSLPNCGCTP
jgi:hypothetical protein